MGLQALKKLGELNKVTLVWISSHQGLYAKRYIRESLKRGHSISWNSDKTCRRIRLLMEQPLPSRTQEFLAMKKERLRISIDLLTEYVALRAHLYNLELAEQKECRLCSEEEEDSIHILCRCPALALKRYRSWMFTEPKDLNKVKVNSLCGRTGWAEHTQLTSRKCGGSHRRTFRSR